jgi:hypothetical protein
MHGTCLKKKAFQNGASLIRWPVVWNETGRQLCEVFVQVSRTAAVTENKRFLRTLCINVPPNYAWHIFVRSKSQIQRSNLVASRFHYDTLWYISKRIELKFLWNTSPCSISYYNWLVWFLQPQILLVLSIHTTKYFFGRIYNSQAIKYIKCVYFLNLWDLTNFKYVCNLVRFLKSCI